MTPVECSKLKSFSYSSCNKFTPFLEMKPITEKLLID